MKKKLKSFGHIFLIITILSIIAYELYNTPYEKDKREEVIINQILKYEINEINRSNRTNEITKITIDSIISIPKRKFLEEEVKTSKEFYDYVVKDKTISDTIFLNAIKIEVDDFTNQYNNTTENEELLLVFTKTFYTSIFINKGLGMGYILEKDYEVINGYLYSDEVDNISKFLN